MTERSEPTPRLAPRRAPGEAWRSWPAWWRYTLALTLVAVLVVVAGGVVAVRTVRASLPRVDGQVAVTGATGPRQAVEVARDGSGIPEVRARTTRDVFWAQGYAAAQDRFYAMDVQRRAASGTLAELWGADALDGDKLARTVGWRRTATAELALLDPGTTQALAAYADGVNAWMADREGAELSVEYVLLEAAGLGSVPRDWEPVDSLAVLKSWAWSMAGSADREVETALLAPRLGAAEVAELFPDPDLVARPPVVRGGGVVDGVFEPAASASGSRAPRRAPPAWAVSAPSRVPATGDLAVGVEGPATGRGADPGGTAVAVSGELSESGRPLLVNDVLGEVSLPGRLSQVTLRCVEVDRSCPYDVSGFALTGVPGVLVGRTPGLAWGLTSLRADTTDLFLERLVGGSVEREGTLRPVRGRDEEIEVAGAEEPFSFTVRSTDRGPLVSDVSPGLSTVAANTLERLAAGDPTGAVTGQPPAVVERRLAGEEVGYGLAVRWTGAEPGRTMDALLALNRADGRTALREAANLVAAPGLGLVWADDDGIGYQAAGRVPVRTPAFDGRRVGAGWDPATDWRAEPVPFAALPHTEDPESGVVVAADQAPVDPTDYPYDLGHAWDPGYRSDRVGDLVAELVRRGPVRVGPLQAILDDTQEPLAPTLVPLLVDSLQTTAYASAGQDQLDGWDGRAGRDSAAAAYFAAVVRQVLRLTFDDEVPAGAAPAGGPRWTATLEQLLADPDSRWWDDVDTPQLESRDVVLGQAQRAAVEDLVRLQARDPARWRWGDEHRLRLRVPGAGTIDSALAGWMLEAGPYDVDGDGSAVAATGWDARDGFEVTSAPLARTRVDLGEDRAGGWVGLTGVSGHAWSRHLVDQTELWHAGDLLPWRTRLDPDAVDDLLVLSPRRARGLRAPWSG